MTGILHGDPLVELLSQWTEPEPEWWPLVLERGDLKAPFPWFGGKSKVVDLCWERFGEVVNYVEPFAGSLAMLLGRPHKPVIETVNDLDGHLVNLWRSVRANPEAVAQACDWPVLELDLHARHRYLTKIKRKLAARLLEDPHFCNPMIAGWWVWGLCLWIGGGWCADKRLGGGRGHDAELAQHGKGVHARGMGQVPTLAAGGSGGHGEYGVHAQHMRMPSIGGGNGTDHPHLGRGVLSDTLRTQSPAIGTGAGGDHGQKGVHVQGMQLPAIGGSTARGEAFANHGKGVHAGNMKAGQLPVLRASEEGYTSLGQGVHSAALQRPPMKRPAIAGGSGDGEGTHYGVGVANHKTRTRLYEVMDALALRLRYTRVTCGDFERILSPAVTWRHGTTAILLDPPYVDCETGLYAQGGEREAFERSFAWALANGGDKRLRIAFCYFDGSTVGGQDVTEAFRAAGWEIVAWKARGGYGAQDGDNKNAARERIAFSPGCLGARQRSLFA